MIAALRIIAKLWPAWRRWSGGEWIVVPEDTIQYRTLEGDPGATAAGHGVDPSVQLKSTTFWPSPGFTDTEIRCHDGTGGVSWIAGVIRGSSRLRR